MTPRTHEDTEQRIDKIFAKLRKSLYVIVKNNMVGQWIAEVNVANGGTSRIVVQVRESIE